MSNQVEISPNPVEWSDVQNPVALHQTNPVSNTSVEFITILSNGIDQDPVKEMTTIPCSFKTLDEFTDEEYSLFNFNIVETVKKKE